MIIDNFIKIKTKGCRKLDKFKELGYDTSNEYILLKIEHLNIGSRQLVDVICDYCNKEVKIFYKEYLRNISIGSKYSCCKKCGSEKAKESNIKNIGVEYPMMLKEVQEKSKKTNKERYGVEYPQQSEMIKEKTKKTCLDKYGFDHISKTDTFKQKYKETCQSRYNVDFYFNSDDFKSKSEKTLYDNYKVDNPTKSHFIINKIKNTNLDRYGVENYLVSQDFNTKNKKRLNDKWNCNNIMKSDIFRKNKFSISSDNNLIKYIDNSLSLMFCDKGHQFEIHIDNYIKRKESNIPLCTICNPIGEKASIKEKELLAFIIENYDGKVIETYRDNIEIDIFLPDLNIGFEFNGLYWHSELYKDKWYHLNKTNYFKERGIRIIHIWEDDWIYKQEIVKSMISNILKLNGKRIFARKCVVREIKDSKLTNKFLEDNHIQGKVKSVLKLGLYYNGELVSLMTFDHFEGRKKMEENSWNLSRFCNKLNTNIIGGASKLLNYFIKEYRVNKIISYADKDWSNGNLYYKLGFHKIYESKPDYKYIILNKRAHKSNYKKNFLKTSLTESQEMKFRNIHKVFDCGKIKFQLEL